MMDYLPGYDFDRLTAIAIPCERCAKPFPLGQLTIAAVKPDRKPWRFMCDHCASSEAGGYPVPVAELLRGAGWTLDWLGQIASKQPGWLDAAEFLDCLYRLRTAVFSAIDK